MNRLVSRLLVLMLLIFPQNGWADSCDHGVSFSNGNTTRDLTAKVTCVDGEGRLRRVVHFVEGEKHGLDTAYVNGRKQKEEPFVHNQRHGEVKRYDLKTGALTDIETYVEGRQSGLDTRFHAGGRVWEKRWVTPGETESKMTWDESGNLVYMNCGAHPVDAKHEAICAGGSVSLHYRDGSLRVKQSFKDGRFHGKWTEYNGDGSLFRVHHYVEGEPEGRQAYYRRDGSLEAEESIHDGELVGVQSLYHPDGKQVADRWEIVDKRVVERERFYQNGHRAERRVRREDQVVVTRFEDAEGKNVSTGAYLSRPRCERDPLCYGKPVGEHQDFHPSGKIKSKSLYENGILSERTTYDEEGETLQHERYYPDGSRK